MPLFLPPLPTTTIEWSAAAQTKRADSDSDGKTPARLMFGPGYGAFLPSSSAVRSMFGDAIWSFSVGLPRPSYGPSKRFGALRFTLEALAMERSGNDLFTLSPTVGYAQVTQIGKASHLLLSAFVGPTYFDYSLQTPNGTRIAAKRLGAMGGVGFRVSYGQLALSTEYWLFTHEDGLDFSGVAVRLTWNFIRL